VPDYPVVAENALPDRQFYSIVLVTADYQPVTTPRRTVTSLRVRAALIGPAEIVASG
jgi:hypothetical protein